MKYDVAQHFAGVLVVLRKLGTTIVVVPSVNSINTFELGFFSESFHQLFCNTVDASNSWYNPYFVTYTNITILAYISFKGSIVVFDGQFFVEPRLRKWSSSP